MLWLDCAVVLILYGATNGFSSSVTAQQQQQFIAKLSGSNEVPAVSTPATGTAKFTPSADGKSINYVIDVTNMNGVMGAHIHSGKQGENGPVVAGLFDPGMVGPPTGKVNGILARELSHPQIFKEHCLVNKFLILSN